MIVNEAKRHLMECDRGNDSIQMPVSDRWKGYLEMIRHEINKIKYAHQAIYFCQSYIGFDHRTLSALQITYFPLYENLLDCEFPHFMGAINKTSDSPYSLPETLFRYNGRLVSNIYYAHLRYVLQCLTYVKEPKTICEIGGGYGGPARLWLQNPIYRPNTYVIIDLPESLFFAEIFLKMNFEKSEILYITDPKPVSSERASQYPIILCPIKYLNAVSKLSFDLVINTGSLHEMTEEWVVFWMEWLKKQDCRMFYSLNYFAQPLGFMVEGSVAWSPKLTKEWSIRLQSFDPHFIKTQTTRSVAEILAEKTGDEKTMDKSALLSRYELLKNRYLDGQILLEALDVVRIYPQEDIIWDLLTRCVNEMKTVPKEAYYLAEYLTNHASADFKDKNGTALQEIRSKLHSIRSAGKESMYLYD